MRLVYSAIFYLALPFVLLRQLWRARRAPDYAKRWGERFACFTIAPKWQNGIWLHGVSLGEMIAAKPLIAALRQQYPDLPITLTTTTPTGSAHIQKTYGDSVFHVYLPYDLPNTISRFLKKIKPRFGIIMETELWPNLCYYCHKHNIPLLLANARLSPQSSRGYQRIPALARDMLKAVTTIAAQSTIDAQRYISLGKAANCVHTAGNLKFNQSVPANAAALGQSLRAQWGANKPVWIAASTHAGEESAALAAHALIRRSVPDAILILVPRHPERFAEVTKLVQEHGFIYYLRSKQQVASDCAVLIGDTMGELMGLYAAADVAFVGGSLAPIGGHNPLEPLAQGVPALMGPHVFNMQSIAKLLVDGHALRQIDDADSLSDQVLTLLQHPEQRSAMANCAKQLLSENSKALDHHMSLIKGLLT